MLAILLQWSDLQTFMQTFCNDPGRIFSSQKEWRIGINLNRGTEPLNQILL